MKKLAGWVALAGIGFILGAVGGIERELCGLGRGIMLAAIGAALLMIGAWIGERSEA